MNLEDLLKLTPSQLYKLRLVIDTLMDNEGATHEPENKPLSHFVMTPRLTNCMRQEGIHTTHQFLAIADADLMKVPNLGKGTLDEARSLRERILTQ